MTVYDDKGRAHPNVGTGAKDFWNRRTNQYVGCSCPPWRYNPRHPKPTDPNCAEHGYTLTGRDTNCIDTHRTTRTGNG